MTLSRRDFIKLAGLGASAMALRPFNGIFPSYPWQDFPQGERLGRTVATLEYRSAPRMDYPPQAKAYEDSVFPIIREVVTASKDLNFVNQRWFETPNGYLYAGHVQPVRNIPNEPLTAIPEGKKGFWAEVTVPYVDMAMDNPPARSPWAKDILAIGKNPRLYYLQVVWIDQIKTGDNGQIMYRFNEDGGRPDGVTGGSYGDIFWAAGRAFRPLTAEDVAPINPNVDPGMKRVVVRATRQEQNVSCFEGQTEVYFCKCSTGYEIPGDDNKDRSTPSGESSTWRKAISIHMSGGASGAGYDTPGISWTNLFVGSGIAIHAAFWHNHFGQQFSHGCVNVTPEDAKWICRWTAPSLSLDLADITLSGEGGTRVAVTRRSF
jgi:hypothetical protein